MAMMTYVDAIRDAQRQEMLRDPDVFVAGEDVALMGSSFGQTAGLYDEFGAERVLDTPISEGQIVSLGVGAAAMGLRPVLSLDFCDFLGCCFDEILNQAAKMSYMLNGQTSIPLVIRANLGGEIGAAAQHSQCLEALFTHLPGLKVVASSGPRLAKGLLSQAIRDNNPVMCFEHKGLNGISEEVPEGAFAIPFGKAEIKTDGRDVTVLSWSKMLHKCVNAAAALEQDGIGAEVIDLVSLYPLDIDTILASVEKTGRVVIAHESVETGGFGGEIAARLADEAFDFLDAPIKRVGSPFTPVPFSAALERHYQPNEEKIAAAVKSLFA
ncbi:MAG: alpha-ketoacid dehydrogenase subunit beta [Clostridiales Family XIII bacterium]|jgi:pyruvate dehydrogenase E1 component beta subunit|nr:alpha-ketoacid dehydrogenase subunit beta [Clostridiales Family XIII bacterium]